MLLSLFDKNFPRMFTPSTRRPESASMSRIVSTASYRMEFPTFLEESVFVATCMVSLDSCFLIQRTYLREDVVDLLADMSVAARENSQQLQDLALNKGICNACYVVLRRIS